jgi:hypothetical protein
MTAAAIFSNSAREMVLVIHNERRFSEGGYTRINISPYFIPLEAAIHVASPASS